MQYIDGWSIVHQLHLNQQEFNALRNELKSYRFEWQYDFFVGATRGDYAPTVKDTNVVEDLIGIDSNNDDTYNGTSEEDTNNTLMDSGRER